MNLIQVRSPADTVCNVTGPAMVAAESGAVWTVRLELPKPTYDDLQVTFTAANKLSSEMCICQIKVVELG